MRRFLLLLATLGLTLMAPPGLPPPASAQAHPPTLPRHALGVPLSRQQTGYSCGPAALRSVLKYFGVWDGPEQQLYKIVHTSVEEGTLPEDLAAGARHFGLSAAVEPLMTIDGLPPLRDVIERHELRAKKSLGQNFLLDLNLTGKIARSAGNLSDCTVLEIGPGPGGLTRALLANDARHVVAIERDERCLAALAEVSAHYPGRLTVIPGDALAVDLGAAIAGGPVKIVANLKTRVNALSERARGLSERAEVGKHVSAVQSKVRTGTAAALRWQAGGLTKLAGSLDSLATRLEESVQTAVDAAQAAVKAASAEKPAEKPAA